MYKGISLIVEGAETGNRIVRLGAKDLRECFDKAHEDVFAIDVRCLMPEVYS